MKEKSKKKNTTAQQDNDNSIRNFISSLTMLVPKKVCLITENTIPSLPGIYEEFKFIRAAK